jgi:peptide/nickel transport system substrate-binding protein
MSSLATRAILVTALAGMLVVPAATVAARSSQASAKYLTAFATEPTSGWTSENFNPLIPSGQLDFTKGAIYEPLMVITQAGGGRVYPWLATKYKYANHNKSVVVTLRKGVKWSDGKALTAADVAFTFNYGKAHNVDLSGLMTSGQIKSIKTHGKYTVTFNFKTKNTTVLQPLLSNVCIIPKHIWKNVKNPLTFTNSNPVGSGPFTKVVSFSNQEFTLGKNPHYWQKVKYAGIRVPAFSSNTSALVAMRSGTIDWAPVYVADAQKAYVSKDPKHFHYFYSPPTTPLALFFNDQVYPYNVSALPKAISMSINRHELSVKAELGYEKPSDAVGIKFLYPGWVNHSLNSKVKALSTFSPKAAKNVLKAAHFTWKKGVLTDPKGHTVTMNITCPAGWSDWQVQLQILQNNLTKGIGLKTNINFIDQNTWFANRSSRTFGGKYGAQFGTESSGSTPYDFFWSFMSKESYFPVNGTPPGGSWNLEGWYNAKATNLLKQFRQTANKKLQHSIVNKLQAIEVANVPIITTVTQAGWYTWSTLHFKGFPTEKNYYAYGPGYTYPDDVKIMTSLRPS